MVNFIKKFLIAVLFLLPFQSLPGTLLGLDEASMGGADQYLLLAIKSLSWMDEISCLVGLVIIFIFYFRYPSFYRFPKTITTHCLIAFIIYGIVTGWQKDIFATQTFFGVYDVIKNIAVLYPFAMIRFSRDEFITIIKGIASLGLFLAIFGILAEIIAVVWGWGIGVFVEDATRFGLYRPWSLTGFGSQNYIGMYSIMAFFLTKAVFPRGVGLTLKLSSILGLILLTFSKQVWLGFGVLSVLNKRRLTLLGAAFASAMIILLLLPHIDRITDPQSFYRTFAFEESLDILSKHPLTGLGAGMFGGITSFMWESPVYSTWPEYFYKFSQKIAGIDQFWPQIWAEFGIVGMVLYLSIWVSLYLSIRRVAQKLLNVGDTTLFQIGQVLQFFIPVLIIMGFAGGLNSAFIVYTYFALVGMFLSMEPEDQIIPRA
jgi:hypothetical protein